MKIIVSTSGISPSEVAFRCMGFFVDVDGKINVTSKMVAEKSSNKYEEYNTKKLRGPSIRVKKAPEKYPLCKNGVHHVYNWSL